MLLAQGQAYYGSWAKLGLQPLFAKTQKLRMGVKFVNGEGKIKGIIIF